MDCEFCVPVTTAESLRYIVKNKILKRRKAERDKKRRLEETKPENAVRISKRK